MQTLDGIYQPSGKEWEQDIRRKLTGEWGAIKGEFDEPSSKDREGPFPAHFEGLGKRIEDYYRKTPDWGKIHKERQREVTQKQ